MLRPIKSIFTPADYPDLLVGLEQPDDAAVWRLDDERAIVLTTDFFTPVVDDAYDYGAIAAANSLSDVYAMGGRPFLALNIAALPPSLPDKILSDIIRGGAEKSREAGVVIAGGHTVTDDEPKYGICVTGTIHPDRILTKSGARAGDRLYLTKPIGTGIVLTALKREAATPEHVEEATASMLRLNRRASQLAQEVGVNACTDITGFGLVGHANEMAEKSGVCLRIAVEAVPFLSGALEYAELGFVPGGIGRNRNHFAALGDHGVRLPADLRHSLDDLLHDPQTSGGLLISLPAGRATALEAAFAREKVPLWPIGEAVAGSGVEVV